MVQSCTHVQPGTSSIGKPPLGQRPGHLLSTDRGNIVKQWYDPGNRILTFGYLSKVLIASMTESCDLWTKDSIASITGI